MLARAPSKDLCLSAAMKLSKDCRGWRTVGEELASHASATTRVEIIMMRLTQSQKDERKDRNSWGEGKDILIQAVYLRGVTLTLYLRLEL
jgi:hypothetical protein